MRIKVYSGRFEFFKQRTPDTLDAWIEGRGADNKVAVVAFKIDVHNFLWHSLAWKQSESDDSLFVGGPGNSKPGKGDSHAICF